MRGLICDDHPLMREALAGAVRARWPNLTIVEAADYPSAWQAAEGDVQFALVDLGMPGAEPLAGLEELRARAPDATILVVTGFTDQALLDAVRALGVVALSKNDDPEHLIEAIAEALPALQGRQASRLPARQRQVLELLAQGLTNKEIALQLGIAPATVKIHVARLTSWLDAVNRTDAVARAQRARLV